MEFRKQTIEQFPSVFKKGGKRTASSGYGWFATIDYLTGGDLLKFDNVTKLPLMFCLTKLSLDTDVQTEKNKEMKKKENRR